MEPPLYPKAWAAKEGNTRNGGDSQCFPKSWEQTQEVAVPLPVYQLFFTTSFLPRGWACQPTAATATRGSAAA